MTLRRFMNFCVKQEVMEAYDAVVNKPPPPIPES
jgi:hypothetical protein